MADEATATDAPVDETSVDNAPEAEPTAEAPATEEVDWQAKFEAQQKITRDLEKKVKDEIRPELYMLVALKKKLTGKRAASA